MLTPEQYRSIMQERAIPLVNACLTTEEKHPDAVTYHGLTNSTQKFLFSFIPERAEKVRPLIIEVFKDLPRTYGGLSSYGYVAFDDFFSNIMERERKQKEMLHANALINLAKHLQLVMTRSVTSDEGVLTGADCELVEYIPTRKDEILNFIRLSEYST